jgi:CheY-like chemotaxis protein
VATRLRVAVHRSHMRQRQRSIGRPITTQEIKQRQSTTRPKVLLVDDTDQLREVVQALLERNNCEVVSAATVTESLHQMFA